MTAHARLDGLFEAWRAGDALRAAAYFAVDGIYREAGREPIVGRDAIVAFFTRFFRNGPRFRFDRDLAIVEGDFAAVEYRFAMQGLDGEMRERAGCAIVTFVDGTIAAWREYGS